MTFKKRPVIGTGESSVRVIVYTSVDGSGPPARSCPGPGDVNVVPFRELAPITVKGVSVLESMGVASVE
jgi:hypothetical protein